jgi:hypothetical protein
MQMASWIRNLHLSSAKASPVFTCLHFGDECLEATDLLCLIFGSQSARVITQPCLASFQAGEMVSVHSELLFL